MLSSSSGRVRGYWQRESLLYCSIHPLSTPLYINQGQVRTKNQLNLVLKEVVIMISSWFFLSVICEVLLTHHHLSCVSLSQCLPHSAWKTPKYFFYFQLWMLSLPHDWPMCFTWSHHVLLLHERDSAMFSSLLESTDFILRLQHFF